ncbi:hypothetical protein OS493_010207 [Desmophyllum pertusum]|uniref:FYVE-type domain-containing protein n=1 Tax=Desmophyllum pertusum TaxID=174260 RepID=A0A9X0A3T1_9CNID|nr:hypothetical protein OS493_010207 [Desmophyllum pertusum]
MSHHNSNCYRSKSLNAQWDDLSRSVSYVLNEHEGPKAETVQQVSTSHWVDSLERTHCAEGRCAKKFTLTERKHHCRRCGEVFCGKCSQYRVACHCLQLQIPMELVAGCVRGVLM